jgi:4-hydroxy-3-methylbut-2-enyl diphosphate reductase
MEQTYFRKGFGLKREIEGTLAHDYHSQLVDRIRAADNTLEVGDLTFRLAKEFGFCYGVDRAVEYAYETCEKFPDRKIYLVGEIIHNPLVNRRLESMGVTFLYPDAEGHFDFTRIEPSDVVILPAFGVAIEAFEQLREIGCVLVDTTCGSVLHVWKRVEQYSRDGFTALIHGKYRHEETRATSSQVLKHDGGSFLVVRNMDEVKLVCDYIRGTVNADSIRTAFAGKTSEGFDPELHLDRIGIANQTTMLATESLEVARVVGEAIRDRWGDAEFEQRFRSFDTICSATQDRQDAVLELIRHKPDLMLVLGGYNSSNTTNLANICTDHVRTYHIETDRSIDPERGTISHKQVATGAVVEESDWLPAVGELEIGLTAGASTPDSLIGRTVERILASVGENPEQVLSRAVPLTVDGG